jgi:phage major head subunit gpT-like protein
MLSSANYGRLLEPGLRKIFMETYKEIPEQYSQVFNVQQSNKAIETDLRMGGFGLWDKKDSAGSVQFQDPTDTAALQYIHEEFASGFTLERKLVDDEQYGQINKMSAALARSARATIETKAAEVFNNAFTVNGFDGNTLISSTHKRLDGGAMSNRLANTDGAGQADGALSDRNLKAALIQTRRQVDDRGILIQVQPKILVVPPSLEYAAKTILQSAGLSPNGNGLFTSQQTGSTALVASNTEKNVIQNSLQVVVLDYLTSNTAWFLIDPVVAQLNFFWRKRLEFSNEKSFETMQQKYIGYCRFSVGYSDYRGIFGSNGTGNA